MRQAISIIIFLLLLSVTASSQESLLMKLDEAILNRQEYEAPHRRHIDSVKADYERATADIDRYNILRSLYNAYRTYRIDSAIVVASKRLNIARRLASPSKIASASLNLAEGYLKSGAPDRAIAILDTLEEASLEDYHRKYRNSVYRNAYEMKASTAMLGDERMDALAKIRMLRDADGDADDEESLSYYKLRAEKLHDAGLYDEAVAIMEEGARKFDFSRDAAMQYTLGEMYLAAGQKQKAIESLARSALIDITSATKEYRSLILLASILFDEGDIHRAFEYINCAFEDAYFSKANIRTNEIMRSMPVIDKAFHEAQQKAAERSRRSLVLAGFLVVLLLLLLALMIWAFREKRKMYAKVEEINRKLEEKNDELVKADSLKLQHINTLMLAYAGHISRLRDFRKTVYRLMATSQYDKAVDAVKSDKAEQRDIAAFHEMFDEAFLSMFPTFVEDVNRFMVKPVEQKTPMRLTPELRVVAMMKLGMNSTEEIAGMLHYSSQTVYNLRSSIRNSLGVSWSDFETYLKGG